jgi:hypothetical protein
LVEGILSVLHASLVDPHQHNREAFSLTWIINKKGKRRMFAEGLTAAEFLTVGVGGAVIVFRLLAYLILSHLIRTLAKGTRGKNKKGGSDLGRAGISHDACSRMDCETPLHSSVSA